MECSDSSEEPAFDAQAWRADCLAQVADLEAAALAAEARAAEALLGISPEAAEVIRQASHKLAAVRVGSMGASHRDPAPVQGAPLLAPTRIATRMTLRGRPKT